MKTKVFIIIFIISILIFTGCNRNSNDTKTSNNTESTTESNKINKDKIDDKQDGISSKKESSIGYIIKGTDLHIIESGTKIMDMTIKGNLYIDKSIGDGEFYIEDSTIKGSIYVHGGGPNSGYLINVYGKNLIIESDTNPNVVLSLNTRLEGIQIASDCRLESTNENVKSVVINNKRTADAVNVILKGNYPEVTIESTANIMINGEVSLMSVLKKANLSNIDMIDTSKMYFFSSNGKSVTINGGTIVEAWINAEYCSLPNNTDSVNSEIGVANVTVGSKTFNVPAYNEELNKQSSNNDSENTKQESSDINNKSSNTDMDEKETNETNNDSENDKQENTDIKNEETAEPNETSNDLENNKQENADINNEPSDTDIKNEETTEPNETSNNSENTETTDSNTEEKVDLPLIITKLPTVSKNTPKITINLKANKPCTLYVLVEDDMIFKKGSTPEKVRDGISAGAGMIMDDMSYIVIHKSFDVKGSTDTETFILNMMDYMPEMSEDDQSPPPENNEVNVGVFLVLEDENGELSILYSY